jgi:O-antigen ligase
VPRSQLTGKLSLPELVLAEQLRAVDRVSRWILLGGASLLGAVGWSLWSAATAGGDPTPFVALAIGAAGALILGRILSASRLWVTPAVVVISSVSVATLSASALLSPAPISGPLGYANAKAAFFVQAAAAALMLAVTAPGFISRLIGAVGYPLFGVIASASGSVTATAVVLLPCVGLAGGVGSRVARSLIATFAVLFLLSQAASLALAARFSPGGLEGPIDRFAQNLLDRRRVSLWSDALVLMTDHPVTGVGPGRFAEFRTTAPTDPDARWAHHEFLQLGAEIGLPGYLLALAVFVAGFGWLWGRADAVAAVAAGAMAAIGIHASLDYVLHFPLVPLAAAGLLGAVPTTRSVASRA